MKRYDIANQVKCVLDDLNMRAKGLGEVDITKTNDYKKQLKFVKNVRMPHFSTKQYGIYILGR